MENRFNFNAIVTGYYDIDTPDNYEEFEPQIYLKNVDVFSDEIGIDYDRLLEEVQNQLNSDKPEISQIMQNFEDNSCASDADYVTIKPDKVLQCTGLKDRNGFLIYEGDILKFGEFYDDEWHSWDIGQVYWGGKFDYPAFELQSKATDFDTSNGLSFIFGEGLTIEVLGNIYQNKELWNNEVK